MDRDSADATDSADSTDLVDSMDSVDSTDSLKLSLNGFSVSSTQLLKVFDVKQRIEKKTTKKKSQHVTRVLSYHIFKNLNV